MCRLGVRRNPGVADRGTDGCRGRPRGTCHVRYGNQARNGRLDAGVPLPFRDDKPDSAGVVGAREAQAGRRMGVRGNDDVLEQVAKARFDRPLEAGLDLEIVGHRTEMGDLRRGLCEDEAGRVAVFGTRRRKFLERLQTSGEAGEIVLSGAEFAGQLLAASTRTGQLRVTKRPVHTQRIHGLAGAGQPLFGSRAFPACALGFHPEVVALDFEFPQLLDDSDPCPGSMIGGMAKRGRGVDGRKDFAAGGLNVGLEAHDVALKIGVDRFLGRHPLGRFVALGAGFRLRIAPGLELDPCGLATGVQRRHFLLHVRSRPRQVLDLLLIEGDLLLEPADRHLARVRGFPCRRRLPVGLGQFEAQPLERRFYLREVGRGSGLTDARVGQSRACGLDRLAEYAIAIGELHLLPAPQLVTQASVAPRLGGLPLQRAPLLLDLVDDVVNAGEVLLRGFELELGLTPPALVLRDPGRFFDQLPAIGGAGAQDLTDLSLLDDRVGLDAQARIHEQILHIAEAAGFAVDQVLTLARAIEAPHQFDVLDDQRRLFLDRHAAHQLRPRGQGDRAGSATIPRQGHPRRDPR